MGVEAPSYKSPRKGEAFPLGSLISQQKAGKGLEGCVAIGSLIFF